MHQIEKLKNKYNVISLFKKKFGSTTFLFSTLKSKLNTLSDGIYVKEGIRTYD